MRIYLRGKTYWMQWRGRRSLDTSVKEIAERRAHDYQRSILDPYYAATNETTTLTRTLAEYVTQRKRIGRAPGTIKQYDVHIGHLQRILGATTQINAIDAKAVDRYLANRHAEGASERTQHKEICTLRGALKLQRRYGRYPHAIEAVIPAELSGASPRGKRALKFDQIEALLGVLTTDRAAVVAFIVTTAADWHSVELAEPDDDRGEVIEVRGTKTATRHRVIPILEPFKPFVKYFRGRLPFEPWGNVRRDLAVACKRAKVPAVTPRDLRRSHGRILRASGIEPHLIGKMLGHADSRMAELVYGQLEPDELAELMHARLKSGTRSVQIEHTQSRTSDKTAAEEQTSED